MEQATRKILAGMKKAIQAERTGYEFYKVAAKTTKDPTARKVFAQLAEEEAEHFRFLTANYESFRKAGRVDRRAKLSRPKKLDAAHPIFSAGFRARLKDAHFEMSALAVAVQLELNGIRHYRAEAAKATDPDVKRFYEDLSRWESGHYDALAHEQQELQEAYWAEAGFAPF